MRKKIPVLAVLIVLAVIVISYMYLSNPPSMVAQLIIDSGQAEVMHPGGAWQPSTSGMELMQGDSVRTLEDSEAKIIFFESTVMRLAPDTEIAIQALSADPDNTYIYMRQESGRTWNKILRLSGISSYEMETPTTVVSVRGTAFSVEVEDGMTDIILVEGEMETSTYEVHEGRKVVLQSKVMTAGKALSFEPGMMGEMPMPAEAEVDEFIARQLEKDDEFMEQVRLKVVEKLRPYAPIIKERFDLTDEQLRKRVTDFVEDGDMPVQMRDMMEELVRKRLEIRPQAIAEPVPIPLKQVRETIVTERILTKEEMAAPTGVLGTEEGKSYSEPDTGIMTEEPRLLTDVIKPVPQPGILDVKVPGPEPDVTINETDLAIMGLTEDIGSMIEPARNQTDEPSAGTDLSSGI